jgi:hypothetical protein
MTSWRLDGRSGMRSETRRSGMRSETRGGLGLGRDSDASSSFQIGVAGLFTRFSGLGFGRSSWVLRTYFVCQDARTFVVEHTKRTSTVILNSDASSSFQIGVAGLFTRVSGLLGVCYRRGRLGFDDRVMTCVLGSERDSRGGKKRSCLGTHVASSE